MANLAQLEKQLTDDGLNFYTRNLTAVEIMQATSHVVNTRGDFKPEADADEKRVRMLAMKHFGL